jgi:hypothetical protein
MGAGEAAGRAVDRRGGIHPPPFRSHQKCRVDRTEIDVAPGRGHDPRVTSVDQPLWDSNCS